jgi:glyoxylase-like metal-dependent hydrolase (beta-lactamase superfamily II)
MRQGALIVLIVVLFAAVAGAQPPARQPSRQIVQITGDPYRARNNNYFSIFLVAPDGIILADPVNAAFATWLKEQFAQRFKVPVRYVIYSHSHWDHIEGGEVLPTPHVSLPTRVWRGTWTAAFPRCLAT